MLCGAVLSSGMPKCCNQCLIDGCIVLCSGASMGGGVKLGAVRFEYATDQNQGTSNIFVRFGERF